MATSGAGQAGPPPWRPFTVPNALSLLRLLGVPLFLWCLLTRRDGLALAVVVASGVTDYLDGVLARRLGQTSRIGQLLDPAADRLYILATLVGFTARAIVPPQLTAALVARDVLLGACLLVLRRYGYGALPVHYVGKVATFNLLFAFPFLLLGDRPGAVPAAADVLGWALILWGSGLYWYAGLLYLRQFRTLLAAARAAGARPVGGSPGGKRRVEAWDR